MTGGDAPQVLVLDANQRAALAVVRSLGRQGLRVWAADHAPRALAGESRFCERYLQTPCPRSEPAAFISWLQGILATQAPEVVFPVTEISSQLLLREQLPGCRLPFADLDTVMALADKGRLIELAREVGVPVPESRRFSRAAELDPRGVQHYPVVLKPCLSRLWLGDHWLETSVHIAHDSEQLQQLLETRPYLRDHPFLLQDFVPGSGAGVFALYHRGQAVTFFAHRRLREKPPSGGVSVLSSSTAVDPHLLLQARKLLDAVHWHGVAMIEFRVTPDGEAYLMEINTRFWGSLQLAIDSGVDFPWLLWQGCSGNMPQPPTAYRTGQRLRWLLGDVDSLYLVLRSRQPLRAKLRRVLDFLTPAPRRTRHEVNRPGDLRPAWFELRSWLRALRGNS